jgi:ferric-dicitrate binding protein FerR (iron transport regulator)
VENTFNHIDELIGKHLAGETSREENVILRSWLEQSEANRKHYDQFKLIFTQAPAVRDIQQFDADAAWNKVRARLHQKKDAKTIAFEPEFSPNLFWRIAASIVLVMGIGFFAYKIFQPSTTPPLEVITEKKSEADTLPDGSDVFLNKETKLAYSFDKKKKIHKVKLEGEAYFNIQHQDDKKFIVEVEDAFIRDIGTSFNVKAYPESNTIEVVVEEGEVMFYTEKDSGIYLKQGGKGIYHKETKTFSVEEAEPNVTAYKTRFFIFSDTDLSTAVASLNTVYDKKIVIGKNLEMCRLTVSFNNESIVEIAHVIAETLGLTVKEAGQTLVLEGEGCEK